MLVKLAKYERYSKKKKFLHEGMDYRRGKKKNALHNDEKYSYLRRKRIVNGEFITFIII